MNPAGSKRLQFANNSRSRILCGSPHIIFCIHFCLFINKLQSTFATRTNTSRYHKTRSELLAFNNQAFRSDICFIAARPNTVVLVAGWWIEITVLLIQESINKALKLLRKDSIKIVLLTFVALNVTGSQKINRLTH